VRPRPVTTPLIRYACPVPSVELCQALFDESGAFAVPGAAFDEEHSVRLGCACARDILEGGLAAISAYLRTLEGCLGRRG
jgi:aspartate/methionine/tyrosine aminotransferase